MATTTNHTPTPWMLGRGSLIEIFAVDPANPDSVDSTDALHVATIHRRAGKSVSQSHADAAFIVRACNSHDELVRRALDVLEGLEGKELDGAMPVRVEKLRAALAAAGAA